jgi:hypothetical protein
MVPKGEETSSAGLAKRRERERHAPHKRLQGQVTGALSDASARRHQQGEHVVRSWEVCPALPSRDLGLLAGVLWAEEALTGRLNLGSQSVL